MGKFTPETSINKEKTREWHSKKSRLGAITVLTLGLGLAALIHATPAQAAVCTFTDPYDTQDFQGPYNWDCHRVPGSTDDAIIPQGKETTLNDNRELATLVVDGRLTVFADASTTLLRANTITIHPGGSMTTKNSTVEALQTLTNQGLLFVDTGNNQIITEQLINEGQMSLVDNAGPEFTLPPVNRLPQLKIKQGLINQGIINGGKGAMELLGTWTNQGQFNAGEGLVRFNGRDVSQSVPVGTFYDLLITNQGGEVTSAGDGKIVVNNELIVQSINSHDVIGGKPTSFAPTASLLAKYTTISAATLKIIQTYADLGDVALTGLFSGFRLSGVIDGQLVVGKNGIVEMNNFSNSGRLYHSNPLGTVKIKGNWVQEPFYDCGGPPSSDPEYYAGGLLILTGAVDQTIPCARAGVGSIAQLIIDKPAGSKVDLSDDLSLTDAVTLQGGTFRSRGHTIYLSGNWTNQGGIFDSGSERVYITPSQLPTQSLKGEKNFYDLVIDKNNGGEVAVAGETIVNHQLYLKTGGAPKTNLAVRAPFTVRGQTIVRPNNIISVADGQTWTAEGTIANEGLIIPETRRSQIVHRAEAVQFTDANGQSVSSYAAVNKKVTAYLTVHDTNRNLDGTKVETVTVPVWVEKDGQPEARRMVQLTETTAASGIFRAAETWPVNNKKTVIVTKERRRNKPCRPNDAECFDTTYEVVKEVVVPVRLVVHYTDPLDSTESTKVAVAVNF